jgi:hypothetical protein
MPEITTNDLVDLMALTAALLAELPDIADGVSTGSTIPTRVHLRDKATEDDIDSAQAVLDAHDPVFLSVDKTVIVGDGVDTATIMVTAPKVDAAPVVLLVEGTPVAVALVDGIGIVTINSDPATIHVLVQDAENRSSDALVIEAR